MTLQNVGLQPVQLYAAPAFGGTGGKFRVTNTDETSTIYLDAIQTITAQSTPLPPQATITYGGNRDVWASSLSSGVSVLADVDQDSLTWDNPVGVQIALNDLGLATAANQVGQETAIPANIQVMGAPPYIPNLNAYADSILSAAGSPYTLHTFASASRLWYASLSLAVATDSAYAGGLNEVYAQLQLGGTILLAVNACIGAGGVAVIDHSDLSLGGIPIPATDSITVNVNGGTSITDAFIRVAAAILVSTP